MDDDKQTGDTKMLTSTDSDQTELPQCVSPSAMQLRASAQRRKWAINPHVDRLFSPDMELGVGVPGEQEVKIAESYQHQYQHNKTERMRSLGMFYQRLDQPQDLIVMLYCKKFFPMFVNWLASCEKNKIDVKTRLITFALDQESHRQTELLGIKTYFLDPERYGAAGASSAFGDRMFSRTMFYKNAIVSDVLELGANVLFQDVDMLWLRDPFEYFATDLKDSDIHFMYDGRNPIHKPLYANTGFIYVKCNSACKAFFETAVRNTASIFHCRSHQMPLNRMLAYFATHNVLAVNVLPQELFLNGHLFNLDNGVAEVATNWQQQGYVVHYSWTADLHQKTAKIKKFGFDYLPGDDLIEQLDGCDSD